MLPTLHRGNTEVILDGIDDYLKSLNNTLFFWKRAGVNRAATLSRWAILAFVSYFVFLLIDGLVNHIPLPDRYYYYYKKMCFFFRYLGISTLFVRSTLLAEVGFVLTRPTPKYSPGSQRWIRWKLQAFPQGRQLA